METQNLRFNTISFIVPLYNVEKYIRQCLLSIINQINILPGSEIIVVNDGTKDNSMDIVRELAIGKPYISIIEQVNGGLSNARNKGLSNAKCDYLWFVDSDDWLLDNALENITRAMLDVPNADLYVTGLAWLLNGNVIKEDIKGGPYLYDTGIDFLKSKHPNGASPRYIIKREILIENDIRFLEGIIHEDAHFGHIMPVFAKKTYVLPTPVYAYRQREDGSIMHSITIRSAYDSITIHKDLMQLSKTKIPVELRNWFVLDCRNILMGLYQYIKPLYFTKDYNKFYKINRNYIKREIWECISICDDKLSKYRMKLFYFSPRMSIYLTSILSHLIKR